jgi:2-polyprenyl-3-methyl-5-hydroxy-6-metoxy-1,4-benzoquinol methylase
MNAIDILQKELEVAQKKLDSLSKEVDYAAATIDRAGESFKQQIALVADLFDSINKLEA